MNKVWVESSKRWVDLDNIFNMDVKTKEHILLAMLESQHHHARYKLTYYQTIEFIVRNLDTISRLR